MFPECSYLAVVQSFINKLGVEKGLGLLGLEKRSFILRTDSKIDPKYDTGQTRSKYIDRSIAFAREVVIKPLLGVNSYMYMSHRQMCLVLTQLICVYTGYCLLI